jgi:hypothetical protein
MLRLDSRAGSRLLNFLSLQAAKPALTEDERGVIPWLVSPFR